LPDKLYERLLEQRIVLAAGVLDETAATRLSAQLLTLDAEGGGPIRLELQNLHTEPQAALTLMGVLDVVRAEVQAFASGETGGPALSVLASCPRRLAYPNASFTLSEPRLRLHGSPRPRAVNPTTCARTRGAAASSPSPRRSATASSTNAPPGGPDGERLAGAAQRRMTGLGHVR
jgi:ATP-dependent protease ClpP protease subunit